ncbi:MAG: M20 family metallopeptidase [Gammaproteobacteria bacterium]|jgi:succinyl-diaminopimelate desuccinylase|nr:M20 family metallopeptidase [Gammaproteobacteria bacterium]
MNSVQLTQELVRINTVNPPGDEHECAKYLGKYLQDNGFNIHYHEFAKNRTSLVARIEGSEDKLPICFTGHIDTVPLGATKWSCDPFAADIDNGKLFGRGTSDMKAGVAAFVAAAVQVTKNTKPKAGLELVITAGEETGCEGANHMAQLPNALKKVGAIIVGEPTSNYPLVGHKGAYWLRLISKGITAHGSMPEKGDNAIYKMAKAVNKLANYQWTTDAHAVLGMPTLNVSTIQAGMNINSVPDRAEATVDIRTIPDQKQSQLMDEFTKLLGDDVEIEEIVGVDGIWAEPENNWVKQVFSIAKEVLNVKPVARSVSYFTDGPSLAKFSKNPPTLVLGPGEAAMAHQTDEFCFIDRIEEAVDLYERIAHKWCYE